MFYMKLYVFKINNVLKGIFLAVMAILLILVFYYSKEEIITVFQQKRDLPIYSVDCPDKKKLQLPLIVHGEVMIYLIFWKH